MGRKFFLITYGIQFLLIALFLTVGCSTLNKGVCQRSRPKMAQKKKITNDVLVFLDLQQIDLDQDRQNEIIAVYSTNMNATGVKVIKFHGKGCDIIYHRSFNSQSTRLRIEKGTPIITVEGTDYPVGCGLKNTYIWDGKAFVLSRQ